MSHDNVDFQRCVGAFENAGHLFHAGPNRRHKLADTSAESNGSFETCGTMADLYNLLEDLEQPNEAPRITEEERAEEWDQAEQVDVEPKEMQDTDAGFEKPLNLDDFQAEAQQELPYSKLQQWWKQERKCPELLPFDSETMQLLVNQLDEEDEDMNENDASTANANLQALLKSVRHIDQERIQFLISDLLRVRMEKIERYALYLRHHTDRLSDAEVS